MGRTIKAQVLATGTADAQHGVVDVNTNLDGVTVGVTTGTISNSGMPDNAILRVVKPGRDDDHPEWSWQYNTGNGASEFAVNTGLRIEGRDLDVGVNHGTGKNMDTTMQVGTDLGSDLGSVSVTHNFNSNTQSIKWSWSKDATTLEPTFNLGDNSYSVTAKQADVSRSGDSLALTYNSKQDVMAEYNIDDLKVSVSSNLNNMTPRLNLSYSQSFDL